MFKQILKSKNNSQKNICSRCFWLKVRINTIKEPPLPPFTSLFFSLILIHCFRTGWHLLKNGPTGLGENKIILFKFLNFVKWFTQNMVLNISFSYFYILVSKQIVRTTCLLPKFSLLKFQNYKCFSWKFCKLKSRI